MRVALGLIALLALSGCATVTDPDASAGVVEYRGNASPGLLGLPYVRGDLDVWGCRLNLTDVPEGCFEFHGERCTVRLGC